MHKKIMSAIAAVFLFAFAAAACHSQNPADSSVPAMETTVNPTETAEDTLNDSQTDSAAASGAGTAETETKKAPTAVDASVEIPAGNGSDSSSDTTAAQIENAEETTEDDTTMITSMDDNGNMIEPEPETATQQETNDTADYVYDEHGFVVLD